LPLKTALYTFRVLHLKIDILRKNYNLEIESPFSLVVSGNTVVFDALIKGYGAKNGMVIDSDGSKLIKLSSELSSSNYGFSCLNLNASDVADGFDEILEDWGASGI
jgi:hypothetical protein